MQKVRRASPACKWGISGSISLLSFQPSFTVLIHYRYVIIFSFRCMVHLSSNNSTLVFGSATNRGLPSAWIIIDIIISIIMHAEVNP